MLLLMLMLTRDADTLIFADKDAAADVYANNDADTVIFSTALCYC